MSNDQSLSKSAEKVEKIEVKPKPEDNEFNDASTSHIDIGEINDTIKPLETSKKKMISRLKIVNFK